MTANKRASAMLALVCAIALSVPATVAAASTPVGSHDFGGGNMSDVDCRAAGWAVDPDDPETEVDVRILVDGTEAVSGVATEPRQDVVDAGYDTDNESGFNFELFDVVPADAGEHEIRAQARDLESGEWFDLDGTPTSIVCTGMGGFHDAFSGRVGRGQCVAAGWTRDRHDSSRRLQVRVAINGDVVLETTADEFRQDILDAGLSDGYSGWTVDLWAAVEHGVAAVIRAEALDEETGIWFRLAATDIAILCEDDSDALFVRDMRTGAERQLTDLPLSGEYNAAFSPDGKLLAHDVVGDIGHQLWVTDVRTGASNPVPGDHLANDPSWSPDGKWLAVDRLPDGDASVWRINARTGAAEPIVGDAFGADWHPEADRIVFVRPESSELVVRDLRTGNEWHLATLEADIPDDWFGRAISGINPTWSPDGRWVLYSDGADLFKIRLTGASRPAGEPIRLTDDPAIDNEADWTADGSGVLFQSNRSFGFGIWRIPAAGGDATVVTDAPGANEYNPVMSMNGRLLAFTRSAAGSLLDTNLVINGDAELGEGSFDGYAVLPIPGWSSFGNVTVATYDGPELPSSSGPGPDDRGANLFSGGPDNESSGANQVIDVNRLAGEIDGGAVNIALEAHLGGFIDQDDQARVVVVFHDGENELGSIEVGPVTAAEREGETGLLGRSTTGVIPAGTRYLVVSLLMAKDPSVGAYNDGYADNVSVVLSM